MANVKTVNLPGGLKQEKTTNNNGSSKTVTFKPTFFGGRDVKSIERREPKKR